ncbi:hypothetical protein B9Z36_09275 [Limnohabitans sp. Rim8]|jgi:hypothetical protein|nr:hypothetical protein B9Z36_09275 [Limnohabitans sp. Rim8]
MLMLIYLQLRKNIKETDRYFAAIDLSLRQFFANISNVEAENDRKRHDEILRHLDKISTHSSATARILNDVHNPKSVEDEYYESEQNLKWLAKAKIAKEKSRS